MKTYRVNDTGLGMFFGPTEWIQNVRVYEEGGAVQVWIVVKGRDGEADREVMQYLTPPIALEFSKALKRCAKQAKR